jgi:hypothetical protein
MPTDDVIDLVELRQELIRPGALWQQIDLTPETGSTNADLANRAKQGRNLRDGADRRLPVCWPRSARDVPGLHRPALASRCPSW